MPTTSSKTGRRIRALTTTTPLWLLLLALNPLVLQAAAVTGVDSFAFYFPKPGEQTVFCEETSCAGSAAIPGSALTMNYDAHGTSTFGTLKGFSEAAISGSGTVGGGVLASTNPFYVDGMTFSGEAPGSHGSVIFLFHLSGSSTVSAYSGGTAGMRVGLSSLPPKTPPLLLPDANGNVTSQPISFIFGEMLETRVTFFLDANIFSLQSGAFSTWNYSDTVNLDGIEVFDASGHSVPNFGVVSESGTTYDPNGVAPEPGTLILIAVGLLVVLSLRYRHASRSKGKVLRLTF